VSPPAGCLLTGGEALVVGFAVTGQAVAEALGEAGYRVRAVDDATGGEADRLGAEADRLGVELLAGPSPEVLAELAGSADLVVLSPGIPPSHPVLAHAPADRVISEIELGWLLLEGRSSPLVAVTGTNGKTTVVSLVVAMLRRSGKVAVAAGNIGLPLVEIARRPEIGRHGPGREGRQHCTAHQRPAGRAPEQRAPPEAAHKIGDSHPSLPLGP